MSVSRICQIVLNIFKHLKFKHAKIFSVFIKLIPKLNIRMNNGFGYFIILALILMSS